MNFSTEQTKFIAQGAILNAKLQQMTLEALQVTRNEVETKRHTYIFSPPGAGKTYTVKTLAEKHGVGLVKLQGSSSVNAFVIKLATAVYAQQQGKLGQIMFWIDDCDSLFMDFEALNVMKGALDAERNVVSWNKNFTQLINGYMKSENTNDNFIGQALQAFQVSGSVGIEIPTDNVRFIVTSNKPLTAPADPGVATNKRKMHESAIRNRVNYKDFTLDSQKQWGWIAHIALNADVLKLSKAKKTELLAWMWDNWSKLPATTMRDVMELAAMVVNFPKDYHAHWELTLNA